MRMTHDILSVKLYELDKAIGQMHSRIEQGEMDCPEQVEKDIQELRRECRENREMLHNKMKYSRSLRQSRPGDPDCTGAAWD